MHGAPRSTSRRYFGCRCSCRRHDRPSCPDVAATYQPRTIASDAHAQPNPGKIGSGLSAQFSDKQCPRNNSPHGNGHFGGHAPAPIVFDLPLYKTAEFMDAVGGVPGKSMLSTVIKFINTLVRSQSQSWQH